MLSRVYPIESKKIRRLLQPIGLLSPANSSARQIIDFDAKLDRLTLEHLILHSSPLTG
jgi:hypothetical protein